MNLGERFDEYTRRARVYPGMIAALPVLISAALFLPREPLLTVAGLLIGAGATYLLASLVRSQGKKMEERLIKRWDGFPTTKMLRHREKQNVGMFERRRRKLEQLYGEQLPTRGEEANHPGSADERYVAATRFLITLVRERRDDFPRVHEENISYGFARNLLGLKPVAIAVALVAIVGDGVFVLADGHEVAIVVAVMNLVLLVFWVFFVKSSWVLQAGTTYAERLFEALESPSLRGSASGERVVSPRAGEQGSSTVPASSD